VPRWMSSPGPGPMMGLSENEPVSSNLESSPDAKRANIAVRCQEAAHSAALCRFAQQVTLSPSSPLRRMEIDRLN
jgi:hypothetical protein